MKTLQVGEFKSHFSEVIEDIKRGEEVAISFGKKKEKIAVLVPYAKYSKKKHRKIGILKKKASFKIKSNFKISEEEFLGL
ncbi:MAG: type II toxin-antitoxin system Phd/YefM family antitoxin [Leptospiraceae bacterium]|nr:type II toxin-antitoxin system Phd/YefM family antitoxin [Leptospiraceae bacterium]MCP5512580.1 type II toxin-antitoxin system Phd/YefM family antitoxin [Leptospiraceae bacterium]